MPAHILEEPFTNTTSTLHENFLVMFAEEQWRDFLKHNHTHLIVYWHPDSRTSNTFTADHQWKLALRLLLLETSTPFLPTLEDFLGKTILMLQSWVEILSDKQVIKEIFHDFKKKKKEESIILKVIF